MILGFGEYQIDTDRRELRRAGEPLHVEPQVFDLILYLAENRERVISKDELFERVWKRRVVSDATLSSRINAARRALGDSGDKQSVIRTVSRRGFRFTVEVSDVTTGQAAHAGGDAASSQNVTFCRSGDGLNLAVGTVGDGPVLVKTANWLGHIEYDWKSPLWRPLFGRLSRRHKLIRYDARGTGLSDWNLDAVAFEDFVSDLETVVDSLGLERFSLFGISQGAAVAIAYAARHPERVDKMVLHGGYAQGRRRRESVTHEEQADAFLTLLRHGWGDEHSPFMQAFSSIYLPRGTSEQIRWFSDLQRVSTTGENAIRLRSACDLIDVKDLLPQIRTPTLVTHSRHDHVAPFEQGRLMATSIPQARFFTVESDNHALLPEEPAWNGWVDEIEAFLANARSPDTKPA